MPITVRALVGVCVLAGFAAGCGSAQPPAHPGSSAKPDLTTLTDAMVLQETDFPSVSDSTYKLTSVWTVRQDPARPDDCDPGHWARTGDQAVLAEVTSTGTRATYTVEIVRSGAKVDLQAWAGRCLPRIYNSKRAWKAVELPDAPPGAVGSEMVEIGNQPVQYLLVGYVRGLQVTAGVGRGMPGMPDSAQEDLVRMFNAQAAQLNSQ